MDGHLPETGIRISLNSHLGTIKYVGLVANTTGTWIGVEWDDPSRGKHDGSKDGKQYFTCRFSKSGSFFRPTAHIQYGVTFLEALTSKYIESMHGSGTQEKVILGSSGGAIEVEAVSLDKIRAKFARLDHLREVSLDNALVFRGDAPRSISQTCPNIRGLDLSQNLLPSWEAVAQITKELPLVQRLSLNRNRLQLPSSSEHLIGAFEKLLELQLNNTLLTWPETQTVIASMPRIQAIEIGYNQLTSLGSEHLAVHVPSSLTLQSLNLDSNLFSDWSHVCSALREYKSLERLILTANRIESIPFLNPQQQKSDSLLGIQYLSLSDNQIASWISIDALSTWLPQLKSLIISGNPLLNDRDNGKHARPFIISKIPSLVTLDGTTITSRERTDSELFYLSLIIQHGLASDEKRQEEHPRWTELCEKHGRPNEAPKQHSVQDKLSNRLIDLKLYQYSESMKLKGFSLEQAPETLLQVLPSMSLRILRMKICKTLKYDARRTKLRCWLRMVDGALSELEGREDSRDLDWLGIDNGSQIVYQALQ